jgi:hypothetical protein
MRFEVDAPLDVLKQGQRSDMGTATHMLAIAGSWSGAKMMPVVLPYTDSVSQRPWCCDEDETGNDLSVSIFGIVNGTSLFTGEGEFQMWA